MKNPLFTPEELAELARIDAELDALPITDEEIVESTSRDHQNKRLHRTDKANKRADYHRRYREANKAELAEKRRRYREANKAEIAEKQRRYREANKEKYTAYMREYMRKRSAAKKEAAHANQ